MKSARLTTPHATIIAVESENVKIPENKKALEDQLECLEPIVTAEVEKRAHGLAPDQLSEIKQNVRIKLWHALESQLILYPRAYIRVIVQNVFYDLGRVRKPPEPLPLDDYGEINQGRVLINQSEEWGNPEQVAEQRENAAHCLALAVEAISRLPRRQKIAMICFLHDRVDDVEQLREAFESFQMPPDIDGWPTDKADARRLRALISVARHKVAAYLNGKGTV